MKIILTSTIELKDHEDFREITKKYESNVIPHVGHSIIDSVLEESEELYVLQVTINYQKDECYVDLAPTELDTKEKSELKKAVEIALENSWKCKNVDIA